MFPQEADILIQAFRQIQNTLVCKIYRLEKQIFVLSSGEGFLFLFFITLHDCFKVILIHSIPQMQKFNAE